MRILIADKLSESCIARLKEDGHDVWNQPELKGETLSHALADSRPNILVVRSTKVQSEAMDSAPELELIVRAGAGYDNIDVKNASARGIFVANCPGKNADAVAELTLGLMLALDRSIPDNVIDARAGNWKKTTYGNAAGIKGRTLGIVGLGNIGRAVVRRAQSFEMRIIAWSRSLTDEGAISLGVEREESPVEVARNSDIVTLHVAATADTESLADSAFFDAMKPGTFFINTTRHSVVDEQAMIKAIDEKGIRVALDVFSNEPSVKEGPFSHPLASRPDVYITHHIGASTLQAQEAIADEAVRVILKYAETNSVENCINIATQTAAVHQLMIRHVDRVGVLASILNEISDVGWNVQEMENFIFADAPAACAIIRFHGEVKRDVIERIQTNSDVLTVSVIDL